MTYTEYTTKGGERWDTVAYACYGVPTETARIIRANPHVALVQELPAGIRLNIPIVEQTTPVTALPPWKR